MKKITMFMMMVSLTYASVAGAAWGNPYGNGYPQNYPPPQMMQQMHPQPMMQYNYAPNNYMPNPYYGVPPGQMKKMPYIPAPMPTQMPMPTQSYVPNPFYGVPPGQIKKMPYIMNPYQQVQNHPQMMQQNLQANLSGSAEVPGPGDTNGSGNAVIQLNSRFGSVCYDFNNVQNIANPNAAHIHSGASGVSGPIAVPLFSGTAPSGIAGCVSADGQKITDIGNNPAGYYVNLHNTEFPDGAIRGQLQPGWGWR